MKTFIYILLALLAVIAFLIFRRNQVKSKQYKDFLSVFENSNITMPELKFGWSYSWPTFTVMFANKADFEYAAENKMCELFNKKIEAFYDAEFDVEMAISYDYQGRKVTVELQR
nr:hypothetical protein [uncultured Flavobacterium sp.]